MKKPKVRKVWLINPAVRIKKSRRIYQRPRAKQEAKKQIKECAAGTLGKSKRK